MADKNSLIIRQKRGVGIGQLSLLEHALCPLDPRASLVPNLLHDASYFFTDTTHRRRKANAVVSCASGLSAYDEYYLWGLLAITLADDQSDGELHATPHYCLRRLGLIGDPCRSGGEEYRLFSEAIERLAAVHYKNDSFYDPVRTEHRKMGFGFFSYSLPLDLESSRAWRFAWDPIFFEVARATSGHLCFDLEVYRQLDPASRRLFLILAKIFYRRSITPAYELRHLAVDLLGFCPSLAVFDLKRKLARCVLRLRNLGVVTHEGGPLCFRKRRPGEYSLTLSRGPYFESTPTKLKSRAGDDSPMSEPLRRIGCDDRAIRRLQQAYPKRILREWVDITLAALERNGPGFFKVSPAAFLIDNLREAALGRRTTPDWWNELKKAEAEAYPARARLAAQTPYPETVFDIAARILPPPGQLPDAD